MKKVCLVVVLSLVVFSTSALADEKTTLCTTASEVAGVVAEARYYYGVPMSKAMEAAKDNAIARSLVLEAYSLPDFSVRENQEKAVRSFKDMVFRVCYETIEN